MNRTLKIFLLLYTLWYGPGTICSPVLAQSGELQLNLLLDSDQILDWSREYEVVIADQIPATITLGKVQEDNTVIGILAIQGLENRLILHGIENHSNFTLHEWVDNNIRSGSLELSENQGDLSGYWYNHDKTLRLTIHSKKLHMPREIRQYQHEELVFHTLVSQESEHLISSHVINQETWRRRQVKNGKCLKIQQGRNEIEFCRTGTLALYPYHRIDLVRLLHGLVPQIPHDEIFNSQISRWLDQWAEEVFQASEMDFEDHRWSHNQSIWFTPDYISEDLISGLLSVQFLGQQWMHSQAIVYDRQKNQFYSPADFFRSHTSWGDQFQELARQQIYKAHGATIDIFPEALERIRFHMTLNPQGILISSDFTPYFGRLQVQLDYQDYREDLQRFAPFRKLIHQ